MRKAQIEDVEAQFWARVDRGAPADCWEWMGTRNMRRGGYGQAHFRAVSPTGVRAHRLAWTLTHGPVPDGLDVLHRCDNPPCCNPAHLFLGTDADNSADCRRKGRHAHGERVGGSKLTAQQVATIKGMIELGESRKEIARRYGVTSSMIDHIAWGQAWSHVPATVRPFGDIWPSR